jgi:hypothetical protein
MLIRHYLRWINLQPIESEVIAKLEERIDSASDKIAHHMPTPGGLSLIESANRSENA